MNRYVTSFVVLAMVLLLGGAATHAAPAAISSYDISWDAMTGGTEQMGSTHYSLYGTTGQAVVDSSTGNNYQMNVGFWYGTSATYSIYLPIVLKNN